MQSAELSSCDCLYAFHIVYKAISHLFSVYCRILFIYFYFLKKKLAPPLKGKTHEFEGNWIV